MDNDGTLPSGKPTLLWKMTIKIVSFPMNSMVIFHSHVKLPESNWVPPEKSSIKDIPDLSSDCAISISGKPQVVEVVEVVEGEQLGLEEK